MAKAPISLETQQEIARLWLRGYNGKQIAARVSVSHNIVCKYLRELRDVGILTDSGTGVRMRNAQHRNEGRWSKLDRKFCRHGHYMSKRNTFFDPEKGTRRCKKCRANYQRAYMRLHRSGFLNESIEQLESNDGSEPFLLAESNERRESFVRIESGRGCEPKTESESEEWSESSQIARIRFVA